MIKFNELMCWLPDQTICLSRCASLISLKEDCGEVKTFRNVHESNKPSPKLCHLDSSFLTLMLVWLAFPLFHTRPSNIGPKLGEFIQLEGIFCDGRATIEPYIVRLILVKDLYI